jgi:glycosyltransferase involved in cell wall biosynthesis
MTAHYELLSMVFPAWNEEEMLDRTVAAAVDIGDRLVGDGTLADYEIVLVDDGSTDHTPELVEKLAADDRHVRPVHHDQNRGLGASIRSGFHTAAGDVVLYTDADLPFDLVELHKALRLMRLYEADIVSMYRLDRTGEGPKRFIFSHIYNWLVRYSLDLRVRDVNFAGKLIRRDVLDHLALQSEGSFLDAELMAKAERLGFTIVQFGVDYFPRTRGTSTLASGNVIAGILRDLFRWRHELRQIEPLPGRRRSRG